MQLACSLQEIQADETAM